VKTITVYLTKDHGYDKLQSRAIKIWIDNSLQLGRKLEDMTLVNNFPWEYRGLHSLVVDDVNWCPFRPGSSKTISVATLFDMGFFKTGELYWVHDPDAFENHYITDDEVEKMLGKHDLGLTDYGYSDKWSLGSYFFRSSAGDIFRKIRETIYSLHAAGHKAEDENAACDITDNNSAIANRVVRLNVTYNFGSRKLGQKWDKAEKPIKVTHFRLSRPDHIAEHIYGRSVIGVPFVCPRLAKIMKYHYVR
jgi:hypothetical protein